MQLNPSEQRQLELANWRVEVIRGLRALAESLACTTQEQFPTPDVSVSLWSIERPTDADIYNCQPVTTEAVRTVMAAIPGGWNKYAATDYVSYSRKFTEAIKLRMQVNRSTTCAKVKVGTKVIPAQPERTEDVYEWRCGDPAEVDTNG